MKVYVDVIFFINLIYDFLILNMVNLILRRNIKVKRLFIASFMGSISAFSIFIPFLNNIFITIIISILMVIIAYGYKDTIYLKNNILYFYFVSVIYGGMIYLFSLNFGNIFKYYYSYEYKIIINFIGIIIGGVITYIYFLYLYKSNNLYQKNYYKLSLSISDKLYNLNSFYDSGNLIKDPYKGRMVILINEDILYGDIKNKSPIYVPVNTIGGLTLLSCYKPNLLIVNNKVIHNCLIALFNNKYFKDNVNAILSGYMGDYIR